jgi:dipeptidyl aminopeptidase/acylaminoacyl peptidase
VIPKLRWQSSEVYSPRFFPVDAKTILVEDTVRGERGLFEWRHKSTERSRFGRYRPGSHTLFSFSSDRGRAAFVHSSFSTPPEVYIQSSDTSGRPERVSNVNQNVPAPRFFAREITWKSRDQTTASGWLFEPLTPKPSNGWPVLTYVHGGPVLVVENEFAQTFGCCWPYPLEVLPSHGIAVFVPNYRGTGSFGASFRSPATLDGAPVDDIVSGIETLELDGIVDAERVAIAGHSHGAWLAALVLTREKNFRAASLAEGMSNLSASYALARGLLNREVHDQKMNGSLYDAPEKYNELSPDLHFSGVLSANLFEGGAFSQAINMLAYTKASRREGLPTETVVYPRTGHSILVPSLRKEAAERNLEWFTFWLQGQVSPDEGKHGQFARWRSMRTDRDALRRSP